MCELGVATPKNLSPGAGGEKCVLRAFPACLAPKAIPRNPQCLRMGRWLGPQSPDPWPHSLVLSAFIQAPDGA